jgi:D-aspartate ligase
VTGRGAIVVGGWVNGLGIVRALGAGGFASTVVRTRPWDIAHRSRWARERADLCDLDERPEALADLLERRRRAWAGAAVLPTNDGALAALAAAPEALLASYRILAPPREAIPFLLDKRRMLDAARAVGLDVPLSFGPASAATAARDDLRFPVVVKPVVGHLFQARFGSKLLEARDRAELQAQIARVELAGAACDVFDLVPGADAELYSHSLYVDSRGEPSPGLTVRKRRQSPPRFGVARVAEIVAEVPALREATIALVRHIGLRGAATAEFKRDPRDGRWRFLEVNGRSVIYNALLRRGGLDVAALAWADVVCGERVRPRVGDWRGVWIHLHADVLYFLARQRAHPLGVSEFLAPYRRRRVFAVWSATDPLPFLAQWARTAAQATTARNFPPPR